MARPLKDGRLRMDTSLRIPVTSEQKALITEATSDEPEGMAAWARAVLLQAAAQRLSRDAGERPSRDAGERPSRDAGERPSRDAGADTRRK
jgi:hypothetical protein